jgi:hypothetical protein
MNELAVEIENNYEQESAERKKSIEAAVNEIP